MKPQPDDPDADLAFTVSTVWRDERVSCPHPDLLRGYLTQSLPAGAIDFVRFHLQESQCPYCNAVVEDLQTDDREAQGRRLDSLRDRLMRSTRAALRGQG
ncbi:MAG: hypothetical protein AAF628_00375 [Planctomycetota bacterium]